MDVIIQPNQGPPFYLEVGYFDTVLEIKEKILKDQGIPISKQKLVFKGHVLQDDLNVHHSDILDRSRVHLLLDPPPPPPKIHLVLKMHSSKPPGIVTLDMDPTDNVKRLKDKIQETVGGFATARLVLRVNSVELEDHKSLRDYELSDAAEVDVGFRASPSPSTTSSGSSGNTGGGGSRKLKIFVVRNFASVNKLELEVNPLDNVGELRKKLERMKEKLQMDLPKEGYFFVYRQNVMDDDRSFRWHHVSQGDRIEIFGGSVSGGS